MNLTKLILLLTLAQLMFPGLANATWSIAAVDPETGEVGLAAASCTYSVYGVGHVVPGKGVVVVQAMSNGAPRSRGVELMHEGASNTEILAAMQEPQFHPDHQQFAVIQLNDEPPLNLGGASISDWSGGATADNVTVQGNTLPDEGVVQAAMQAYQDSHDTDLLGRLMAALVAGADAGGDQRCGEQRATSAFVTVSGSNDTEGLPRFQVVVHGIEPGGEPAVARLQQEVLSALESTKNRQSTMLFVVP